LNSRHCGYNKEIGENYSLVKKGETNMKKMLIISKIIQIFLIVFSFIFLSAGILYSAEPVCSRGDILFCQDWETKSIGCPDGMGGGVSQSDCGMGGGIVSSPVHSGTRALNIHLAPGAVDTIYPEYSLIGTTQHIFVRWYAMWSSGFVFNANITKHLYIRSLNGPNNWWIRFHMARGSSSTIGVPTVQIYCGETDNGCADELWLQQNVGTPVNIIGGQWYCFEWELIPDTQGNLKSAVTRAWIDGVLIMDWSGISIRHNATANANPMDHIWFSSYYGGGGNPSPQAQDVYYDDIVASTNYIGPSNAAAPFPPKNLRIVY
jgi:hypothetical protein